MQFAAIYKKFLNSRFKGFTKLEQAMNIQSVGWCETKPAQLKSPGRYSSFPFPHLSPLSAFRALPLSTSASQHAASGSLSAFQLGPRIALPCGDCVQFSVGKRSPVKYRGPPAEMLTSEGVSLSVLTS